MVSLHKFFETDNAIYLLLQYASGGKLWTYIGEYFDSDRNDNNQVINLKPGRGEDEDILKENIYSGTKIGGTNDQSSKEQNSDNKLSLPKSNDDLTENQVPDQIKKKSNVKEERIRFSSLIRSKNVTEDSENQDDESSSRDKPNDDAEDSRSTKLVDRTLSSLSDDSSHITLDADTSLVSPTSTSLQDEDHFQAILSQHECRANMEAFSINSIDSEDNRRFSSACLDDRIDSIPEDGEIVTESSDSTQPVSPIIDHGPDVFDAVEDLYSGTEANGTELDFGVARPSKEDTEKKGTDQSEASDDVDDIVKSSKELLSHVDRLLSETNDSEETDTITESEDSSIYSKQAPLKSSTSNDSAEEPSIYDTHRHSDDDSTDSSLHEKMLDSPTILEKEKIGDDLGDKNTGPKLTSRERTLSSEDDLTPRQRMRTSSAVFRQAKMPHKLSLIKMDSKDMTRSASFECDIRSPTRNRARTVTDLFERLDAATQEQVRIPETTICKWMAHVVTALARLHSLGVICR